MHRIDIPARQVTYLRALRGNVISDVW
jgi:hypothetical protein